MNELLFYIFIVLMTIYYYNILNYNVENNNQLVYAEINKLIFHYLLIQNIQNMNQNNNQNVNQNNN